MTPTVSDGHCVADPSRDMLKLAVIERHRATGNVGLARNFIQRMPEHVVLHECTILNSRKQPECTSEYLTLFGSFELVVLRRTELFAVR